MSGDRRNNDGVNDWRAACTWLWVGGLASAAVIASGPLAPWQRMWLIAFALYGGFKVVTLAQRRPWRSTGRALAYTFAWVGMDAERFDRAPTAPCAKPDSRRWLRAWGHIVCGAGLVTIATGTLLTDEPLVRAWVGMVGLIKLLHFGSFELLALAWRRACIGVTPLMNRPTTSRSVGEFWSARWNRAYHALIHRYAFRPLARRLGAGRALLASFALSGVIHELVISVPAGGGYGLPTAYFVLQGLAVLAERRFGWRSRWLAVAVVLGPAFALFHPRFALGVALPMIDAIAPATTPLRETIMNTTHTLIQAGGLIQLSILFAAFRTPRLLRWREQFAHMDNLTRHVVWTHGAYVAGTIVALGTLALLAPHWLTDGGGLGRAVCAFIALFWGVRLALQLFAFDAKPYLTTAWRRLGFHALTLAFTLLTAIFAYAAIGQGVEP